MLLKMATLEGIREGRITVCFRRWKRPTVKAGGRLRTRIGELAIGAVEPWTLGKLSEEDARAAGAGSVGELKRELAGREGKLYRITVSLGGADSRIALRERSRLSRDEVSELVAKLDSMDARSRDGAWTREYLRAIAEFPATRAADLAERFGMEKPPFKQRVRRLKELGLTESLEVGYRLSPRGRALWRRLSK